MNVTYTVWSRQPVMINTDSRRRCYNGCNFSERTDWSEWKRVADYISQEDAESAIVTFQSINPSREYRLGDEVEVPENLK